MAISVPQMKYGTITGRFLVGLSDSDDVDTIPDMYPASGYVVFTPGTNFTAVSGTSANPSVIFPQKVIGVLDSDGYLRQARFSGVSGVYAKTVSGEYVPSSDELVKLQSTEAPELKPTDWSWNAEFHLFYGKQAINYPSFNFQVPVNQTIDLTLVKPIVSTPGEYTIVGPQGPVGPEGPQGPKGEPKVEEFAIKHSTSTVSDLNNEVAGQITAFNTSTANTPVATGTGIAITSGVYSATTRQQTAFIYGSSPQIWMRYSSSSSWGPWVRADAVDSMGFTSSTIADLNNAVAGSISSFAGSALNSPTNASGVVITTGVFNANNRQQTAFIYGSSPQIWMRYSSSSSWGPWVRADAGAINLNDIPSSGGGSSSSSLKRVPLALTAASGSNTDTGTSGAIRFPIHYGATIHRWRVHVRNYNYSSGTKYTSGGSITGMWFGEGENGAFKNSPSKIMETLSIPSDGSETVTPWFNTPITANVANMLSIGWTSSSTAKTLVPGGGWRASSSASASVASGADFNVSGWFPYDWWIEAETNSTTPTVAGYGDSITAGTGTDLTVYTSWLSQYARSVGALPVHYAYPGTGMILWENPTNERWTRWSDFPLADAVIHFMGQNDLGSATTVDEMIRRFEVTLPMVKKYISPNVYMATITPHAGKTAEQNAVRNGYTSYLRTYPLGIRDIFEFASAVSSDNVALKPEYRGGTAGTDELHPNTAGSLAMARSVIRPVTSKANELPAGLLFDSGKRQITLENGWTCYQAILRRQGNTVSLYVRNMTGASATSDTFLTMPTGFRDNAVNMASQPVSGLYPYKTGGTELTLFSVYSGALNTPSRGTDLQLLRTWTTDDPVPSVLPGTPI